MCDGIISYFLLFLLLSGQCVLFFQTVALNGQFSGWLTVNEESLISQSGFRYMPDVFIQKTLDSRFIADAKIPLNTYTTGNFNGRDALNNQGPSEIYYYQL